MRIDFNRPYLTGKELQYMQEAVNSYKLSGNGSFTKRCQEFFEKRYGFRKCLLTTSGTDALEMAALLTGVGPGDEVIVPSYTFVSSALAFVRQGAKIVWADSTPSHPNIDATLLEGLIGPKTKAIVVVHYAGMACDMDRIMEIAGRHSLTVIEDAAQAVDSYYKGKALGSIGHIGCFSFHETKNVTAGGEGGLLVVNDPSMVYRAEILWEKGTNRAEFFRGMVNKYGWVDTGSSFLPAEINAAFLLAQLENLDRIQNRRKDIWNMYYDGLKSLEDRGLAELPKLPEGATNNAHMFYMVCRNIEERTALIDCLKKSDICAVFHYLSLHSSAYAKANCPCERELPCCDRFADCLVRLPMYYQLKDEDVKEVIERINEFYA